MARTNTATANVAFGAPSTTVDDCVNMSDTYAGGTGGRAGAAGTPLVIAASFSL
jgi:N-methylhydantoinase B/oxoprolinase/acetone carboxylase alpha subunit